MPDAIASSVRDVAIVDSAAMPSAPPICCDVLISPEASPASAGWTPASAAIEIGTKEKPMPSADEQEAGQEVVEVRAADRDLREVHEPCGQAPSSRPTSTGLTPSRVTSWAATADQRIAVPATAR